MAKETKTAVSAENRKDQLLQEALRAIEKEYGKGSIMRLGDRADVSVDAIPTGSLTLDAALGIGGYPKGRIIEIYGPESSGKTTLALHAIAECQKEGGRCAFIDAENAIDPLYAKNLGVDIDELILSQPDSGEQALEITEVLIKSGAIDLVVIDSVAALVPQAVEAASRLQSLPDGTLEIQHAAVPSAGSDENIVQRVRTPPPLLTRYFSSIGKGGWPPPPNRKKQSNQTVLQT